MDDRLDLSVRDGIAELRLACPQRRNAIDYDFAAALPALAHRVRDDASVRALVIAADGPAFCVGGDLAHLAAAADVSTELVRMIEPYHEGLATLDELRVPVVTAVQGAVAGGALGLLYVADRVLVAPDARLVSAFDTLGLAGDGGGTWHLPRLIGLARTRRFMALARGLGAAEAVEWGLATRVVASDLHAEARAEAERLAVNRAAGELRGLLRAPARPALQAELEAMRRLGASAFTRDAIASFVSAR